MITPLFFRSVDELLSAVFEALQEPDSLKTVISRARASKEVHAQLTPEDLALLLLMCDPVMPPPFQQPLEESSVADGRPLPDLANFDPANPGDLADSANSAALLLHPAKEESKRQELAVRTYPQLAIIAASSWASVVLPHLDKIQEVYGSNDPFKCVNDYAAQYFFESFPALNPWTQQEVPKDSQEMVRSLAQFLLENWRGGELGAMRTIAKVYLGQSPLSELASIDPPSALMQELLRPEGSPWRDDADQGWVKTKNYLDEWVAVSPSLSVLLRLAGSQALEPYFPKEHEELYRDIVRGLIQSINSMSGESGVFVTDLGDYIGLRHQGASLMPDWSAILMEIESADVNLLSETEGLIVDLNAAIMNFIESGNAPRGFLSLHHVYFLSEFHSEWCSDSMRPLANLATLLYTVEGNPLYPEWHCNHGWWEIRRIVSRLLDQAQYTLSDAFLACWLFMRVVALRRPLQQPILFSQLAQRIPATERRCLNQTLRLVVQLSRESTEIRLASDSVLRLLHVPTGDEEPTISALPFFPVALDDELEERLREILSKRVWEGLPERTRQDLVQAERHWLLLQARSRYRKGTANGPERAIFSHLGCALEAELKLALAPVLDYLKAHFEAHPVPRGHRLAQLQDTARGARTLGKLVKLVRFRRDPDKLDGFPACLAALEASGIVRRVFSDMGKRLMLDNISREYRNPASHADDWALGIAEASALRKILFQERLFPELVLARLESPVKLDRD